MSSDFEVVIYQCEKGHEVREDDVTLRISYDGYEGVHCPTCWAQWVAENVSPLTEVRREPKESPFLGA